MLPPSHRPCFSRMTVHSTSRLEATFDVRRRRGPRRTQPWRRRALAQCRLVTARSRQSVRCRAIRHWRSQGTWCARWTRWAVSWAAPLISHHSIPHAQPQQGPLSGLARECDRGLYRRCSIVARRTCRLQTIRAQIARLMLDEGRATVTGIETLEGRRFGARSVIDGHVLARTHSYRHRDKDRRQPGRQGRRQRIWPNSRIVSASRWNASNRTPPCRWTIRRL